MRDFGRGGERRFDSRGGGFGRGRDRGPATMYQAVCDQCGKACEVPFRPTGERPVYCQDCFGGKREARGGERFSPRARDSYQTPVRPGAGQDGGNEVKKQLEILNAKMDRLVRAVEIMAKTKPSEEKIKEEKAASVVKANKKAAKNKN